MSLSDPSGAIPLFLIGDFVFWGIMLNASAIYNVISAENSPDAQVSETAWAFLRSAILVAMYTVALFPGISQIALWIIVTPIVTISLIASFLVTDSIHMQAKQEIFNLANKIERLPHSVRKDVNQIIDRFLNDSNGVDIDAEFDRSFSHLDKEQIDKVKRQEKG